jgi:hypothetical protein
MKYVVETKSDKSNRKGPIDLKTGWPTYHKSLIVEANSEDEARVLFEKKFPGDILYILEIIEL